jgi:cation transport regulator ChaC
MKTDNEEEETDTDGETVETTEEQMKRRELIHVYLPSMMDNKDEQTEQDKTETYLKTSMEEEQKSSMEEEYNEDKPFEENNDKGKWMTQFSYLTKEEENTLFIAFMTGNVENQKTWINTQMNLAPMKKPEDERKKS